MDLLFSFETAAIDYFVTLCSLENKLYGLWKAVITVIFFKIVYTVPLILEVL